jgi:two-component system, LytTR family, response regulator
MSLLSQSGIYGLDLPMMNPIRTIVASAEPASRSRLRQLLAQHLDLPVVAECESAAEMVTAILEHRPDLAVVDLAMPDGDPSKAIRQLREEDLPALILTGASERQALLAFDLRALDFLIQPIDERRLQTAIERVRAQQFNVRDRSVTQRVLSLLAGATDDSSTNRRIAVKVGSRVLLVEMDQIDWVQARGNYVTIKVGAESYRLREGIGRIALRLDPKAFVRIHRSIIVNARRIRELQPCNSGEYMVVLKDGKELSCSRSYRANLRRLIAAH